ncbi:MAG: hypothetical protein ACREVN_09260 [Gammaproteobacteria bacterium]
MKFAIIIILLLIFAGVVLARLRTGPRHPSGARRSTPHSPYRSVSVSTGLNACRAAETIREQRFLPADAPRLPLRGCDEKRCTCRYEHHADRRAEDRRDPFSRFAGFKPTPVYDDKRRGWDRRRQRE